MYLLSPAIYLWDPYRTGFAMESLSSSLFAQLIYSLIIHSLDRGAHPTDVQSRAKQASKSLRESMQIHVSTLILHRR